MKCTTVEESALNQEVPDRSLQQEGMFEYSGKGGVARAKGAGEKVKKSECTTECKGQRFRVKVATGEPFVTPFGQQMLRLLKL